MPTGSSRQLLEKIQNAKSIAISGHKNLDGDALCSALAMMEFIRINFKKPVTVIYDGNVPKDLEKVPLRFAITERNKWMIKNSDYLVCYVNNPLSNANKFKEFAIKKGKHIINL